MGSPPSTKYSCVMADPPWPYDTSVKGRAALQKPQCEIERGDRHVHDMGYLTMSIDELCQMGVADIVEKNAHLYLWTTNSFMEPSTA